MTRRILIVDDERLATMALQMLLSDQGYEVRTAASASKTIREARSFQPDLLMVDYLLGPGDKGTDLAHSLQKDLPRLRVIIMTGLPEDRVASMPEFEGFRVLAKPLDLKQTVRSVADLIGSSR